MDPKKIEALGYMEVLLQEALSKMELAAWVGRSADLQEDEGINIKYLQMVVKEVSEIQEQVRKRYRTEVMEQITPEKA